MTHLARLLAMTAVLVAVAVPASAQTALLAEAADALVLDGYYLEPGAEPVDSDALARVVADSENDVRVVVLGPEPDGGERAFADDVLAELGSGTIVVFSDEELQVSSGRYTNDPVEAALDAADAEVGGSADIPAYVAAFDGALGSAAAGGGAGTSGGGFGGVLLVGLVLLGLVAALVSFVSSRRRRRDAAERDRLALEEARAEVAAQVAAVAERIVGLSDRVTVADDPETSQLFGAATTTYQETEAQVAASTTLSALEPVADRLDHAHWQLEAVAARLDGRAPPPPPSPDRERSCFFDPTHGAGTDLATLETPAGEREVSVCSSCAGRLRAGETPEPRMVGVGGRQVPVAMAPRSYGGGGLGALGDIAVILGGRRTPYSWGGYGGGWGLPGGGGWGAGRLGGWGGGGWSGGTRRRSGVWSSGVTRRASGLGGARGGRSGGGGGRSRGIRSGGGGRSRGGGSRRGGGGRRR